MRPILVVDSSCLAHISKHSTKGLSYGHRNTGVIFGFLMHVNRLANKFATNRIVFCWDSRKSKRRSFFKEYKSSRYKRRMTPEEAEENRIASEQFNQLRLDIIPSFGFQNSFIQTGYEADDLIAKVVGSSNGDDFIIISTDNDLLQLLGKNVRLFDPKTKKISTEVQFECDRGIKASKWAEVKAVAGCSSDSVPGILGVGEKTAVRYLKDDLPKTTKAFQRIESDEGQEIIIRNRTLVTLPFPGVKELCVRFDDEVLSLNYFRKMCKELGFKSFLRDEMNWIDTLSLS